MKIIGSTILLLILSAANSFADSYLPTPENECTPVDFRESFPLKMRNQQNMSWCFAHSASDYLQYVYRINEQISAADIAINYSQTSASKLVHLFKKISNKELSDLPAQTGIIKIAITKIVPQGYCPESALPSDEWRRVKLSDGTEDKVEIKQAVLDAAALYRDVKNSDISSAAELPWYFKFKNINQDQFFEILKNSTASNLMLNIRAAACKNERKPFGSPLTDLDFQFRSKNIFKNMNESFNRQMPVTIDFFRDVLTHYDNPKNFTKLHTVLLYGRKFDQSSQQCNYLIKNSFGDQCSNYDPKLTCEGGYIWLPENKLFHSLVSQLIIQK